MLIALLEMYDIASQLVSKWARYGPASKIAVTDDFTRLTLDSIALLGSLFLNPLCYAHD